MKYGCVLNFVALLAKEIMMVVNLLVNILLQLLRKINKKNIKTITSEIILK